MKKPLMVLLLVVVLFAPAISQQISPTADSLNQKLKRSLRDQWFGQDKAHHFMASAFLTGFSNYALRQEFDQPQGTANTVSVGLVLSIGIAKEIYDGLSGKGTPSFKDIIADAAGIAVGVLILNVSSQQ